MGSNPGPNIKILNTKQQNKEVMTSVSIVTTIYVTRAAQATAEASHNLYQVYTSDNGQCEI